VEETRRLENIEKRREGKMLNPLVRMLGLQLRKRNKNKLSRKKNREASAGVHTG